MTLVVPYPPGGSNDTFARELGKRLGDVWKVPVNRILETREMRDVFLREGAEPATMTAPQFATIEDEIEGWKKVAAKAGIKPE